MDFICNLMPQALGSSQESAGDSGGDVAGGLVMASGMRRDRRQRNQRPHFQSLNYRHYYVTAHGLVRCLKGTVAGNAGR